MDGGVHRLGEDSDKLDDGLGAIEEENIVVDLKNKEKVGHTEVAPSDATTILIFVLVY